MKNEAPYLSEEHIVAWLDGELQADGEIRQALKQDPALQSAAREYAAISNTFAHSTNDSRFVLPAAVDARVVSALKQEITRNRKVYVPERAPDAAPITKPSTADRLKKVWVRRTSYALALALLLGGLWFGLQPTDQAPVTATNEHPAPEPAVTAPDNIAPTATLPAPAETIAPQGNNLEPRSVAVTHKSSAKHETNVVEQTPQPAAAAQPPATAEANDPAAVMISHRYAKLIKATPTVVVSQSDKMDKM